MVDSVLHYILGWEACEFLWCTMRLCCKHHFIYQKLTGSHIRAFLFFIVMLKHVWSICSFYCQNLVKMSVQKFS